MNIKKIIEFYLGSTNDADEKQLLDSQVVKEGMKQQWENHEDLVGLVDLPDKSEAFKKLQGKINASTRLKRFSFLNYAASFIILVSIAGGIYFLSHGKRIQRVYAEPGKLKVIDLPDGSKAWLNYTSTLEFSKNFHLKKERRVVLHGEAYFEVKKHASKAFVVETDEFDVRVLGTSFNVRTYQNENSSSVSLLSGKVEVFFANSQQTLPLQVNEQVVYQKEMKTFLKKPASVNELIAWKDEKIIFDNKELLFVAKALERKFGIRLSVEPEIENKYFYTFRVHKESIQELIALIETSSPVKFIQTNEGYQILERK